MLYVTTRMTVACPPAALWPLLCESRMTRRHPWCFRLGIPRPVACRLPEGEGRAGTARECVSVGGTVRQRIGHWEPCRRLQFEMRDTDLAFRRWVSGISETFELEPCAGGTRITRRTRVTVTGPFRLLKGVLLWFGLKQVHRYVFGDWADQVCGVAAQAS